MGSFFWDQDFAPPGRHIPRSDLTKKKIPEFVQSFPEFYLSFPEFSPKKMDLRISLVLIGVLAFVHSGEAIKCHQCTSYTEAGCGDPFDGNFSKDCPADTAEKVYFCRKIFQNVRSDVKIIRSCGHEKYTNLAGEQKDEYTTVLEEYNTFVTTCTGDNCNGSPTIKVSMISVLMALVLAAVFK